MAVRPGDYGAGEHSGSGRSGDRRGRDAHRGPLALRPLTQRLLFIDGRRPVEVEWALAQVAPTRIVLLAGRPFDLARAHGRAFYFDQSGALTERFGLRATPTRIRQEGLTLRIAEVPLDENGREIPLRENTFGDFLSNEDLNP